MQIEFMDGWPYLHPRILVDGLSTDHTNASGEICLWEYSTRNRTWMTMQALNTRLEEWVGAATAGFPEDVVLDAHLYFNARHHGIATVEIAELTPRERGQLGKIYGTWRCGGHRLLEISTREQTDITGRWYFLSDVHTPLHSLDDVRALLTKPQNASVNKAIDAVTKGKGERLILLVWDTPAGTNVLTLVVRLTDGDGCVQALETAPTDISYLRARSGPDFDELQHKQVVMFGAGAVGSQVALILAECGVKALTLHDSEPVRPGNVVRHVANRDEVGYPKQDVVQYAIRRKVRWTSVSFGKQSWNPKLIAKFTEHADLVLDATGSGAFTDLLSDVCRQEQRPLVSAALLRGGAVGRICRQAADGDKPISERHLTPNPSYPIIPPGDDPVSLEPGCTSPVNNAPPSAVAALAGRTAEIVIDTLTGRLDYPDEVVDVYRTLADAPFDKVGTVRFGR